MIKAKVLEIFDKDGYQKCCPYGAYINYPGEPLRKIRVGSELCQKCLLFKEKIDKAKITCKF